MCGKFSNTAQCPNPAPPINGTISNFLTRRIFDVIAFMCDDGFRPSNMSSATCSNLGTWVPDPEDHECTLVEGTYTKTILCTLYFNINL